MIKKIFKKIVSIATIKLEVNVWCMLLTTIFIIYCAINDII